MDTSMRGPDGGPEERGSRGHDDRAGALVAALSAFPRLALLEGPTPLQPLRRLSEHLGAEVWVKRDDLTGLGLGGNKVRKLEFLLGDAQAQGCDTVVTFGGLQSNHARQTAAACAREGLRCHLVLSRSVARDDLYRTNGNLLLDELFGATLHICDDDEAALARAVADVGSAVMEAGGAARWIPPGGSEPIGTLGYVAAGLELAAQATGAGLTPADVVVATSTGGTQAGLLTGLAGAGATAAVHGVAVYRPAVPTTERVQSLCAGVAELLGIEAVAGSAVSVIGDQLGEGYGMPTDAMRQALARFARLEGLVLDPVYSGKAAAALVHGCATEQLGSRGPVVLVHTGGSPALFAYGASALG